MKECPDCFYPNPDGWQKCEICAHDLSLVKPSAPQEVKEKRKFRFWAVFAVVAVLGAGFYFYGGSGNKDESPSPEKQAKSHGQPSLREISSAGADLSNPDPQVRMEAFDKIYYWIISGAKNISFNERVFYEGLIDSNAEVKAFSADRLARILESAAFKNKNFKLDNIIFRARLSKLLTYPYEAVRETAAYCAGSTMDNYWIAPLKKMMASDIDVRVRLSAASALVRLGQKEGMEYLFKMSNDEDDIVRGLSAQGLAYSKDGRAEQTLKKMVSSDASSGVKNSAAQALGIYNSLNVGKKPT
ncbi:MAG: HEAT repeat domain-containing protein [Elusimicrobia bacterium]|nr:HEAT repeat domain-containing protein [Elusimicrobiota bacterium]